MLVRDLIYLLQTRANLDHEVVLSYFSEPVGDSITQNFIELEGDFDSVGTEAAHESCLIFFKMPKPGADLRVLK